jgi:hypothetical protein
MFSQSTSLKTRHQEIERQKSPHDFKTLNGMAKFGHIKTKEISKAY